MTCLILDKMEQKNEEKQKETENVVKEDPKSDTKKLLIMIGVVIAVFALVLLIVQSTGNSSKEVITIDDLHEKNLNGESGENNYLYNGFSFVFADGLWYTRVKPGDKLIDVPLHFGPKDLENIDVKGSLDDTFNQNKEVFVTFDPLNKQMQYTALSSAELSLNLAKGILKIPIAACINNETDACIDRPIITCSNSDKPVIYIKESKTPLVILDNNCITIQGEDWDVVKATDRLLLYWYGVF
ncbi:hypothetical protein GF336_07465 [Candidatus Woesearchaeota archaeon]|nr:hypothetical protein [Candidatus Woesearchaeota archaeon]